MGWADCGTDDRGRPIGYAHGAICDRPGCGEKIDRGLAHACGGHHLGGEWFCDGYFCPKHLFFGPSLPGVNDAVCGECLELAYSAIAAGQVSEAARP